LRFGFHVSIAGGFSRVAGRALELGCETLQFFTRNPRGWKTTPLDRKEAQVFRKEAASAGLGPVAVHMPYLPNLACQSGPHWTPSVRSLCQDLSRSAELGADYLVTHVGRRLDSTEEEGIRSTARALRTALGRVENDVMVLLENTAGQGSEIGFRFEQLAEILAAAGSSGRLGVCLDTAHAFQAGYDLSTKKGLEGALREFDATVGLGRLRLLHLNDSRTGLGSRVDRHEHIGEGGIGRKGFRRIVNHPALGRLAGILETPKRSVEDDRRNLALLRSLLYKKNKLK
jgi:deoxyribonuclease-4